MKRTALPFWSALVCLRRVQPAGVLDAAPYRVIVGQARWSAAVLPCDPVRVTPSRLTFGSKANERGDIQCLHGSGIQKMTKGGIGTLESFSFPAPRPSTFKGIYLRRRGKMAVPTGGVDRCVSVRVRPGALRRPAACDSVAPSRWRGA